MGLGRERPGGTAAGGYRHGVQHQRLLGSLGALEIAVPRGERQIVKVAPRDGAALPCRATPA